LQVLLYSVYIMKVVRLLDGNRPCMGKLWDQLCAMMKGIPKSSPSGMSENAYQCCLLFDSFPLILPYPLFSPIMDFHHAGLAIPAYPGVAQVGQEHPPLFALLLLHL
jgi:hypothetical protein